jgi:demethylphylloquinone reductase
MNSSAGRANQLRSMKILWIVLPSSCQNNVSLKLAFALALLASIALFIFSCILVASLSVGVVVKLALKTAMRLVRPAQEGVSRAVARVTVSGRTPPARGTQSFSAAWRSFWSRVSPRTAATTIWAGTGGALFVRAAANAAASNNGAAAAGSDDSRPRVCILGGGFGGLYTAVKLESLLWPRGLKPHVTLVDQAERFTFKPLLYEIISGTASASEVAPTYAAILQPYSVDFVRGRVASVRPDGVEDINGERSSEGGGTVVLTSGESLPYDWLVLALGAETNTFGVPGVKEYAFPFSTFEDASKVAAQLDELAYTPDRYPEVVVVGGGYAGVELAAAVADRLKGRGRIQLVTATQDILQGAPEGQRDAARRALVDEGVSIMRDAAVSEIRLAGAPSSSDSTSTGQPSTSSNGGSSESARSSASSSATASTTDGASRKRLVYVKRGPGSSTSSSTTARNSSMDILEADLVLWAAGQAPVPKIEASSLSLPFPTDRTGATQTDQTLRVLHQRRVFALGDVAVTSSIANDDPFLAQRLPATAQVAFQQADYVAWNVWASINNRPLLRFSYQHLGDMMSLGAGRGAVALPIPIPPPLSAVAQSGPLGDVLRAAGVRVTTTFGGASDGVTIEGPLGALLRRGAYLYRQPTDQQRLRVAASWAEVAGKTAVDLARQVLGGGAGSDTGRRKPS